MHFRHNNLSDYDVRNQAILSILDVLIILSMTKPSTSMIQVEMLPSWNLEPLLVKALDTEEGYGWTLDFALEVAAEYRKYSALCQIYPDEPLVPSTYVDDFWHLHILDTLKYEDDSNNYYGYFLHHFPYFGMRGEDAENLRKSWLATL